MYLSILRQYCERCSVFSDAPRFDGRNGAYGRGQCWRQLTPSSAIYRQSFRPEFAPLVLSPNMEDLNL